MVRLLSRSSLSWRRTISLEDTVVRARPHFAGRIPMPEPSSFKLQVDGSFSRRPGGDAVVVIEHLFLGAKWEANE
jgi:hypothetical protein